MESPVFILGCTKSGTTLMRNLLDGHPNLFAVPFESHFFQNAQFWIDYSFRRQKPQLKSFQDQKQDLINWVKFMNLKSNTLADGFVEGKLNISMVEDKINECTVQTFQDLNNAYIEGIYAGIYSKKIPHTIDFVEKSVENAEYALPLKLIYPKARFIHILRNPYSNLVAIRKYISINRYKNSTQFPFLYKAISAMYNSYYYLFKNRSFCDDYKVVIYDQLIENPEIVMTDISKFLKIEFQQVLTQPTLLGKLWSGNSTSGISYETISNINSDKWKGEISSFEIYLINKIFDFILTDFEFERLNPKHSYLIPNRRENLRCYIGNRLMLKFLPFK